MSLLSSKRKSRLKQEGGRKPSFKRFMHSTGFLAVKFALEFVTCGFIIAGVIRHW